MLDSKTSNSDNESENGILEKIKETSNKMTNNQIVNELPRFKEKELKLGRILGSGSFCIVNEIQSIQTSADEDNFSTENDRKSFITSNNCNEVSNDYVMKRIRSSDNGNILSKAIKGLAIEAKLLSSLDHPHIIKIRAASKAPFDENSFLVMDRLHFSLNDQIITWKKKEANLSKITRKLFDPRGRKKKEIFMDKVLVLFNLSSAMNYMHSHNILHRDLKPENIGFNANGEVQLFDLGLATELLPEKRLSNDKYKLTGGTGTLRYMSPEVANHYPYGKSADVFSFSVLLWQIMTCTLPYETFSVHMYKDLVVDRGYRLPLDSLSSWPCRRLSSLVSCCWSHFPRSRPGFEVVRLSLRAVLEDHGYPNLKLLDELWVPRGVDNDIKSKIKPALIAGVA